MEPETPEPETAFSASTNRIDAQLTFLLAADALKRVVRHNRIFDGSRNETTAEHCWHLTLMAMVFADHAVPGTDAAHVTAMLVVHDLVEIHAGDHWPGADDAALVAAKEAAAAAALFALLPAHQARRVDALWREFEARETREARFARALDALHPMLLIWGPGGTGYVHRPVTASSMRAMKRSALQDFPALWALAQRLLDDAVRRGILAP